MKSENSSRGQKRCDYVADFETTTDVDDCRVWLWGIVPVGHDVDSTDVEWGIDILSFIDHISGMNANIYFHNLGFDGYFIIDWLLKNGYRWVEKGARPGEFTTLISRNKKFYSMRVNWIDGGSVEFKDSLKKLSMSAGSVAEAFDLPMRKLHIDYREYRPVGHQPDQHELDYLYNDLIIIARALAQQFDMGMKKLTVGSDSMNEYKTTFGKPLFERVFPVLDLDIDRDIRGAYRGGWTYCDPRFSREIVGPGAVYDVNSLYPSVMYNKPLPYDHPVWFTGAPQHDEQYPLFVVSITFTAKLREGFLPTIQLKSHPVFLQTEYVSEVSEPTTIALTNVDLELWERHYEMDILSYNGGWKFRAQVGFFKQYIDKWSKIKNESKGGRRVIAKLHLNSLYGKFATNPDVTGKVPFLDDGVVKLRDNLAETRNPVYTAMGVFITAYGRSITINAAQANYDVFAYADTDSIHLLTLDTPNNIVVDDSLGNWKREHEFDYALFWRPKVYMERIMGGRRDGQYEVHVAGLPGHIQADLKFCDFENGKVFHGKLLPKHVRGGIVLLDGTYTLK